MTTIDDIDFGELYRRHMAASGGREKPPEAWDARVQDMNRCVRESNTYVDDFVSRMRINDCATLLDVGCGSGTIGLAVAQRLERVYGLDYSQSMLEGLAENATKLGVSNVEPIRRAWEDDWSDVPVCDVVVASRSTIVMDMAPALVKLEAKARRRIYLTSPAGGRNINPDIVEAVGRPRPEPRPAQPDYIYIINLLHAMERHPTLDYIKNEGHAAESMDFESFVRSVAFSLGGLSDEERERLAAWDTANQGSKRRTGVRSAHWAFISWELPT